MSRQDSLQQGAVEATGVHYELYQLQVHSRHDLHGGDVVSGAQVKGHMAGNTSVHVQV